MKKGFTLVELLAVIALIAVLAVIAVPSVMMVSRNIKEDMYCEKVDMLLTSARSWGEDHISTLRNTSADRDNCYKTVTVGDLVDAGLVNKENDTAGSYVSNPVTNESMDSYEIGLYIKDNRVYAFYNETNSELMGVCDTLKVCNAGEDELADNCTIRPTTKCS